MLLKDGYVFRGTWHKRILLWHKQKLTLGVRTGGKAGQETSSLWSCSEGMENIPRKAYGTIGRSSGNNMKDMTGICRLSMGTIIENKYVTSRKAAEAYAVKMIGFF